MLRTVLLRRIQPATVRVRSHGAAALVPSLACSRLSCFATSLRMAHTTAPSNSFQGADSSPPPSSVLEDHLGGESRIKDDAESLSAPLFHTPVFSPCVVGREQEVSQLWQGILSHRSIQILTGADGVGKSTLASELCQHVQRTGRFSCVQWCDGRQALASHLEVLSESMKGRKETRVLIVVDDVSDVAEVLPLLPSHPQLCVVVTTSQPREEVLKRIASHKSANTFTVGALTPSDAKELAPSGCKAVDAVFESCAYVPLLLQLTSALVSKGEASSETLIDRLGSDEVKVSGMLSVSQAVAVLAELSLASFDKQSPIWRQKVRQLSCMDVVSEELLAAVANGEDSASFTSALLASRLLIPKLEGSGYAMHTLVKETLRKAVTAEDLERASDVLYALWPRRWRNVSPSLSTSLVWSCREVLALHRQLSLPLPDALIRAVDKAATFCAHVERAHLRVAAEMWYELLVEWKQRQAPVSADMTRVGRECSRLLYYLKDKRAEAVLTTTFEWCTDVHGATSVECALVLSCLALYLAPNEANIKLLDVSINAVSGALAAPATVLSPEELQMLKETAFTLLLRKGQMLQEMGDTVPPALWDRLETLEAAIGKKN